MVRPMRALLALVLTLLSFKLLHDFREVAQGIRTEYGRYFADLAAGGWSLDQDGMLAIPEAPGLGLSLVKHIMEAHGGSVELSSLPGEGATFRVIFPLLA